MKSENHSVRLWITKHRYPVGCDYTWTVTKDATSWTAFKTYAGLKRFIKDYNVKIDSINWREKGKYSLKARGYFEENRNHWDFDDFLNMKADWHSWRVDNGTVTLFKIVVKDDVNHLHCLNCNVRNRPVLQFKHGHYRKSAEYIFHE